MANIGMRAVVLVLLSALLVLPAHAADSGSAKFDAEASKQEGIYQSRGGAVPEGYVTGRSLLSYMFNLRSEFIRSLADLGLNDRWLDIGAGEGQAILDYYASRYDAMYLQGRERPGKKAKTVAMSIEDRRTIHWHQAAASLEANKMQYLFGRRLREYSSEELGKFQLITDVLGGFSYTRTISLFMEDALRLLEVNGNFYTMLQDVHSEKGTNRPHYPDASFLTEIKNADGSEVKICSWLKSITCVEVTCELKTGSLPTEVYRIHKVCNNVTVPGLALTHFEAGTPPERGFQLEAVLKARSP